MRIVVNGIQQDTDSPPARRLLAYLRQDLGLTGAKEGCWEGECGSCTVLVGGKPVLACQTPLEQVDGRSVITAEGLEEDGELHPVQQALIDAEASQCGYCTPGMAVRAAALLASDLEPDDAAVDAAMAPNLCRCGSYDRIRRAVHRAADVMAGRAQAPAPLETEPAALPPLLPRPRRPWDLCAPEEREWFEILGDGLVVVWSPRDEAVGAVWTTSRDAWLHVAPSGEVTAFTGKVDVGQDNVTAFRLLVAEELRIDARRVRVVHGDTDVCPFDLGTFGSRSMPDAGMALRRAAAGARALLSEHALEDRERRLVVLSEEPALTPPAKWVTAGHEGLAPRRRDAVTGRRRFVSDMKLPGMWHGAVIRPPAPGVTLRAFDETRARGLVGEASLVVDGSFVGVAAESSPAAHRAASAVEACAEWDEPAPIGEDLERYLREHPAPADGWAPPVDEVSGDVEGALAASAHVLEATYRTAYLAHTPLETRAAIAHFEGDRLTVLVGTQTPFRVRSELAAGLGIEEAAVRVVVPPTGGGYGGKHGGDVALEAARLARIAERPVMVHWSRAEEIRWGYARPMAVVDVRAGIDRAGAITAWDFLDVNAGTPGITAPYRAAASRIRFQPAQSPVRQGSYRALAAPANHFARECHIDELAAKAGLDPVEFRLRNLDDDRLREVLRAVAQHAGWRGTPAASGPALRTGTGVAAGLEKDARVATVASVEVDDDGALRVTRIVTAYDCGAVVNPETVRSQIEGGTAMALGGALYESLTVEHGRVARTTLGEYRLPRFPDVPHVEVVLVARSDIQPAGAGETPLVTVAPAIANAVFDATGDRYRQLPLAPGGTLPRAG